MGIDIYLNGYKQYNERIAEHRIEFDARCKKRNLCERDTPEYDTAQKEVEKVADKMWAGNVGYLRSSYNGSGLFRVLEEIYGFDIGAYLFPGSWDARPGQAVNGKKFVEKVKALEQTALLAMSRDNTSLPWINEFTEITGKRAPDPHETHTRGEAFGDGVAAMIAGMFGDFKGGPQPLAQSRLSSDHGWYLTVGLRELLEFGLLAQRLKEEGKRTYAYISY